jgi:hypothetical protein
MAGHIAGVKAQISDIIRDVSFQGGKRAVAFSTAYAPLHSHGSGWLDV